LELSLINQLRLGISSKAFTAFMKYLIRVLAILMILIIGHWRYHDASPPPEGWRNFVNGMIFAFPFSIGLWLSSFRFGKKHKIITLILMLPSVFIHWMFAHEISNLFPYVVVLIECYAAYALFLKRKA
jgi:hypothetical protein